MGFSASRKCHFLKKNFIRKGNQVKLFEQPIQKQVQQPISPGQPAQPQMSPQVMKKQAEMNKRAQTMDALKKQMQGQLARSDQIAISGAPANPDAGPLPSKFTPPPPGKLFIDYVF